MREHREGTKRREKGRGKRTVDIAMESIASVVLLITPALMPNLTRSVLMERDDRGLAHQATTTYWNIQFYTVSARSSQGRMTISYAIKHLAMHHMHIDIPTCISSICSFDNTLASKENTSVIPSPVVPLTSVHQPEIMDPRKYTCIHTHTHTNACAYTYTNAFKDALGKNQSQWFPSAFKHAHTPPQTHCY